VRDVESGVSKNYASYDVLSRIRTGLVGMGHDPDKISPVVLKSVDELHIVGAEATVALLEKLVIRSDMKVLDIGGPTRMIADFSFRSGISLGLVDSRTSLQTPTTIDGQFPYNRPVPSIGE
jgi:hypothetical protein